MNEKTIEVYIYEIKMKALASKMHYQIIIDHLEKCKEDYQQFNDQQLDELINNLKNSIHGDINSTLKKCMRIKYGVISARKWLERKIMSNM